MQVRSLPSCLRVLRFHATPAHIVTPHAIDSYTRTALDAHVAAIHPPAPLRLPQCNRQSIPGIATTYKILKAGSGRAVQAGNTVTVHATGVVKQTNKKFWSTKDAGQEPFTYQAGVGGVIKGWDQGCLGMQEGEERELIIPAHEGYGADGFPAWGIPPGGTLNFTIEVLNIA